MGRTLVLIVIAALAAFAQNSGIQGQVTDASGAAIPNAKVRITNVDTGVALDYLTNVQGLYIAPSLNPGRYRVDATADGFAAQNVSEFRLEVGQTARFNFEMKPGAVVESVRVTAPPSCSTANRAKWGR